MVVCMRGLYISHARTRTCTRTRTPPPSWKTHYDDIIMGTIASQITSLTIVYSTVYSGADQSKYQSSASLAFVWGIHRGTGEFPAQMASNAENVSIWWRHHAQNGKGWVLSDSPFIRWVGRCSLNWFQVLPLSIVIIQIDSGSVGFDFLWWCAVYDVCRVQNA